MADPSDGAGGVGRRASYGGVSTAGLVGAAGRQSRIRLADRTDNVQEDQLGVVATAVLGKAGVLHRAELREGSPERQVELQARRELDVLREEATQRQIEVTESLELMNRLLGQATQRGVQATELPSKRDLQQKNDSQLFSEAYRMENEMRSAAVQLMEDARAGLTSTDQTQSQLVETISTQLKSYEGLLEEERANLKALKADQKRLPDSAGPTAKQDYVQRVAMASERIEFLEGQVQDAKNALTEIKRVNRDWNSLLDRLSKRVDSIDASVKAAQSEIAKRLKKAGVSVAKQKKRRKKVREAEAKLVKKQEKQRRKNNKALLEIKRMVTSIPHRGLQAQLCEQMGLSDFSSDRDFVDAARGAGGFMTATGGTRAGEYFFKGAFDDRQLALRELLEAANRALADARLARINADHNPAFWEPVRGRPDLVGTVTNSVGRVQIPQLTEQVRQREADCRNIAAQIQALNEARPMITAISKKLNSKTLLKRLSAALGRVGRALSRKKDKKTHRLVDGVKFMQRLNQGLDSQLAPLNGGIDGIYSRVEAETMRLDAEVGAEERARLLKYDLQEAFRDAQAGLAETAKQLNKLVTKYKNTKEIRKLGRDLEARRRLTPEQTEQFRLVEQFHAEHKEMRRKIFEMAGNFGKELPVNNAEAYFDYLLQLGV